MTQAKQQAVQAAIARVRDPSELLFLTQLPNVGNNAAQAQAIRAALDAHRDLGDGDSLSNTQALAIKTSAIEKFNQLNQAILAGITELALRTALQAYAQTNVGFIPTEAEVRTLNANVATLPVGSAAGAFDAIVNVAFATNPPNNYFQGAGQPAFAGVTADHDAARRTALQNRNERIIIDAINAFALSDPLQFKRVVEAQNATAIRTALDRDRLNFGSVSFAGGLNNENVLRDTQAMAIQAVALQKYNALTIRKAINSASNPALLDAVANATLNDATAIRTALHQKSQLGNINFTANNHHQDETLLSTADAIAIQTLAIQKRRALQSLGRPIIANVLVQAQGQMEFFTDEIVRQGQVAVAAAPAVANPAQLALHQPAAVETKYKGVKLEKGDVVQATATFPQAAGAAKRGILVQDHTGKVIDMTKATENLSDAEKVRMALKQAEMYLANYNPGKGPIIISGADAAQANRVLASLLLLRGSLAIEIQSWVTGCEVPKASWRQRQKTVETDFIKEHLIGNDPLQKLISPDILENRKKQLTPFLDATTERRKELQALKAQGSASRAEIINRMVLEGDEVDKEGTIQREP